MWANVFLCSDRSRRNMKRSEKNKVSAENYFVFFSLRGVVGWLVGFYSFLLLSGDSKLLICPMVDNGDVDVVVVVVIRFRLAN